MTFFLHKEKGFLPSTRILGVFLQHLRRVWQFYAHVELEGQKVTVSSRHNLFTQASLMDKRVLSQYMELQLGYYWAVFPDGKYRQRLEN